MEVSPTSQLDIFYPFKPLSLKKNCRVKFVLLIYSWVWYPAEAGLKKIDSLFQKPSITKSSLARHGSSWAPNPCLHLLYEGMTTGLNLCKSCAVNNSCFEFITASVLSCVRDTNLLWSSMTSGSHLCTFSSIISIIVLGPWLWYRCLICCWASHPNFFSVFWPVVNFYIKYSPLHKRQHPWWGLRATATYQYRDTNIYEYNFCSEPTSFLHAPRQKCMVSLAIDPYY